MTEFVFSQPSCAEPAAACSSDDPSPKYFLPVFRSLTGEEAAIKYKRPMDPSWTPEREVAFFLALPRHSAVRKMSPRSGWLVDQFAKEVLGAKRVSAGYASTLWSVLGAFAEADETGAEVRLSQRSDQHGPQQTLRTIQAQMLKAGLLVKTVREQGSGFVGPVHVYAPRPPARHRPATLADLEADFRSHEQRAAAYSDQALAATGITDADAPY